jgi:hypothetical protein
MKVIFNDGPETIRTDEGDIKRGGPAEVSDALGARLLASGHGFTDITEISNAPQPPLNPRGGVKGKNKKEVDNVNTD